MQHYIVGHVGDGNFHIAYLVDPTKPEERELAEQLNEKVVMRALALEGTCSGEHGVGLHKMGFLVEEAGADAIDMMRTVKRALDPKNIMNPGKIFALLGREARGPTGAAAPSRRERIGEGAVLSGPPGSLQEARPPERRSTSVS